MTTNPSPIRFRMPKWSTRSRRFVSARHLAVTVCLQVVAAIATLPNLAAEETGSSQEAIKPRIVTLTVDYGDGSQKRFTQIPWKDGMTILHAMRAAQRHKRGINFLFRGKGPTAMLKKIDDLENKGGNGLNWIFRVNKKLGNSSFAIREAQAGRRHLVEV